MTEELIRIRVCGIDKDGAGREYSITVPSGSTAMEAALEGARKFGLQMPEEAALSLWGRRADPSAPLSDGDRVEITLPLTIDPNDARRLRPERDTGRLLPRAVTAESTGSPEAGTLDFLSGKLSLIEFSVAAPLLQQLLMRSGLSDSPRIHDYHKIRVLNR